MTFTIHTREDAPDEAKENLEKIKEKFGFIPNIAGVLADAPAVLEAFVTLDGIMEKTSFSPVERGVIFMTVSQQNESGYCMAAHTKSAKKMHMPDDVLKALRHGETLKDAKLEALRQYTLGVLENHGRPTDEIKNRFLKAGYGPQQALEIVLGITLKTLTNYTNRLAHTRLDPEFKQEQWDKEAA
jgi:AhpD family alkylhydroperoxidase